MTKKPLPNVRFGFTVREWAKVSYINRRRLIHGEQFPDEAVFIGEKRQPEIKRTKPATIFDALEFGAKTLTDDEKADIKSRNLKIKRSRR